MVRWMELRPHLYKTSNLKYPISVYQKIEGNMSRESLNTWFFSSETFHIERRLKSWSFEEAKKEAIEIYRNMLKELLEELQ